MFCSKCGAQNDDSAKFCEKCGEKLVVEDIKKKKEKPVEAANTTEAKVETKVVVVKKNQSIDNNSLGIIGLTLALVAFPFVPSGYIAIVGILLSVAALLICLKLNKEKYDNKFVLYGTYACGLYGIAQNASGFMSAFFGGGSSSGGLVDGILKNLF